MITHYEQLDLAKNMKVEVAGAEGTKCPRCWKYHTIHGNFRDICDRCCRALLAANPEEFLINLAPGESEEAFIAEYRDLQRAIRKAYERWRIVYPVDCGSLRSGENKTP